MTLKPNEQINEDHFKGTFVFPNDIDLIGVKYDSMGIFSDLAIYEFNLMIDERLKTKI